MPREKGTDPLQGVGLGSALASGFMPTETPWVRLLPANNVMVCPYRSLAMTCPPKGCGGFVALKY